MADSAAYAVENFLNGTRAERPFAKNVFFARIGVEFHHSESRAFLAAVVLLLHEEIQLVDAVEIGSVFLFIVFERFEQAYKRHTALVLQLFH